MERVRKKHKTITSRDIYINYLENQTPGSYTVDYEEWKRIMFRLLFLISKSMIRDHLVLRLDGSMGRFGIEKAKGDIKRRVDFNQTRLQGRTIYHSNLHTDCYYFRFVWRRSRTHRNMNAGIKFYKFVPSQDQARREIGKRGLAAWIKECSKDPFKRDYDAPFTI